MFRRALTRLASSLPSASLAAGAFASLRSAAWCTEAEDKQEFRLLINAAQLDHRAFDDFERIGKATVIELLSSHSSMLCQDPPDVTAVRNLAAELLADSAIAGTTAAWPAVAAGGYAAANMKLTVLCNLARVAKPVAEKRRLASAARKNERGVLSRKFCVSPAVCGSRIHGSIATDR